ncbi:MAG TPA: hypothetical protein VFW33_14485 [Gemmataceae bacterium]|nr:hypothetical protein [Gemmataceae bacterium]
MHPDVAMTIELFRRTAGQIDDPDLSAIALDAYRRLRTIYLDPVYRPSFTPEVVDELRALKDRMDAARAGLAEPGPTAAPEGLATRGRRVIDVEPEREEEPEDPPDACACCDLVHCPDCDTEFCPDCGSCDCDGDGEVDGVDDYGDQEVWPYGWDDPEDEESDDGEDDDDDYGDDD